MTTPVRRGNPGFTLLEVTVALAVLAGALLTMGQVLILADRSARTARAVGLAAILAADKLEQLRGLAWTYDLAGQPREDMDADTCVRPDAPTGGQGLAPSPAGVLAANTPGFVDYLDATGAWVGTGGSPVPRTAYIRRWSIEPLAGSPSDTLALCVVVLDAGAASPLPAGHAGNELARLLSVRTRRPR